MILAHLSELHLGFRAFGRTRRGRNVREQDVAGAFERAVHEVVEARPDLVVIVGDVFDRPDPAPGALLVLTRGLSSLRAGLPGVPVALVAGARDTPLYPGEAGVLSILEGFPDVEVATGTARSVRLSEPDVSLALVPYRAGLRDPFPTPSPDPRARWNVLVAYGRRVEDGEGVRIEPSEWDYVALGGRHTVEVEGRGAWAGSLERVGTGPWREAAEEKGFLTVTLHHEEEPPRILSRPLPVRPVVALAPVRPPKDGGGTLRDRVAEVIREVPGGIEDKVVQLRIQGATPLETLTLRGGLLAGIAERSLHVEITWEAPEAWSLPRAGALLLDRLPAGSGERARAEALLSGATRVLPASIRPEVEVEGPGGETSALRLREGLTALVTSIPGSDRALLRALAPPAGQGTPPWLEPGPRGPHAILREIEDALAAMAGAGALEEKPDDTPPESRGVVPELDDAALLEGRLRRLEGAGEELARHEAELRELRADHAEVAGDLEQATMEWLRERQDAETHLQAYRDRARELKRRLSALEEGDAGVPCPTCGRPLEEHYDAVLGELEEEWEDVVQDGSWWRKRWEQLHPKPEALQELEGRALRLQAAVESVAERLEVARDRVRERDELLRALAELEEPSGADPFGATLREVASEVRDRIRERLLERASRYVARITGSRILALDVGEGALRVEGMHATLEPTGEDQAAIAAALRLAAAVIVAAEDPPLPGVILPASLVERLREEDRFRLLDALPSLRERVTRVVVSMFPRTAERRSDLFDDVLEVGEREDGGGAPSLRRLAAGPGRLVIPGA